MLPPHQRQVVAQLGRVRHEPTRARIIGLEPVSRDNHHHDVRFVAVHVGAQVVRVECLGREAPDGDPIEPKPKRVDRFGAEHAIVADDQRLSQIVEA